MSNVRKNTHSIRVENHVHAKLLQESIRRGCTMSDLVDEMLPGYRMAPCRYCKRNMRQPTQRHRWHWEECALFEDKDLRPTPMAGANKKA